MVERWLPRDEAEYQLILQADAIAKKLGHRLLGWVRDRKRDKSYSRCEACLADAHVRARSFAGAPLSGEALTFRCRKAGRT